MQLLLLRRLWQNLRHQQRRSHLVSSGSCGTADSVLATWESMAVKHPDYDRCAQGDPGYRGSRMQTPLDPVTTTTIGPDELAVESIARCSGIGQTAVRSVDRSVALMAAAAGGIQHARAVGTCSRTEPELVMALRQPERRTPREAKSSPGGAGPSERTVPPQSPHMGELLLFIASSYSLLGSVPCMVITKITRTDSQYLPRTTNNLLLRFTSPRWLRVFRCSSLR